MTRKPTCGNPLFLKWAEDIQEEAEIKQWKAAKTYKKACNSIRSCPLPFTRPQELITLANVGPTMVKMLEQRQKEHYQRLGLEIPPPGGAGGTGEADEESEDGSESSDRVFKARAVGLSKNAVKDVSNATKRKLPAERLSASPDSDDEVAVPPPTKKKRVTAPKLYVPKPRSGGYAILLALLSNLPDQYQQSLLAAPSDLSVDQIAEYEDNQEDELNIALQSAQLTKQEIINAGRSHSDADFEKSEKGGHYTAWSSMKTLTGRALVSTRGNPARYWLTKEGWSSGIAVRQAAGMLAQAVPRRPVQAIDNALQARLSVAPEQLAKRDDALLALPITPVKQRHNENGTFNHGPGRTRDSEPTRVAPLRFSYIGPAGTVVRRMAEAERSEDVELFLPVRKIRVEAKDLTHAQASRLRHLVQVKDVSNGLRFDGWILEANAPEYGLAAGNSSTPQRKEPIELPRETLLEAEPIEIDDGPTNTPVKSSSLYGDDGFDALMSTFVGSTEGINKKRDNDRPALVELPPSSPPQVQMIMTSVNSTKAGRSVSAPSDAVGQLAIPVAAAKMDRIASPGHQRGSPNGSLHLPYRSRTISRTNSRADDIVTADFTPTAAIRYAPGTYDIMLVMDTREIKNRRDEEAICKGLSDWGIHVDIRALKLGDITWIARLKEGMQPELVGNERECVLDYVAERKRLDDLCSSIRDGRYDDQKYRLTNSCIGHVYYIVEHWDIERKPDSTLSLQIATAKSQTQIVSGFFLKETHKLSETIDFLRVLHENIVDALHGQQVSILPERYISRPTYVKMQTGLKERYPQDTFHVTFETFQAINGKSANQTTADVWARMLLCIKGMSAERVGAIIKTYPTARSFWSAFIEKKADWEREKAEAGTKKIRDIELFFADVVQGEGRQKIGDALSRELYSNLCA